MGKLEFVKSIIDVIISCLGVNASVETIVHLLQTSQKKVNAKFPAVETPIKCVEEPGES